MTYVEIAQLVEQKYFTDDDLVFLKYKLLSSNWLGQVILSHQIWIRVPVGVQKSRALQDRNLFVL